MLIGMLNGKCKLSLVADAQTHTRTHSFSNGVCNLASPAQTWKDVSVASECSLQRNQALLYPRAKIYKAVNVVVRLFHCELELRASWSETLCYSRSCR